MQPIIFFDIDGTILTSNYQVPDSARAAIQQARKNGCLCVINTGRPYAHIEPVVKELGFDGYICSCGQHIILNRETVFYEGHSPEVCRELIAAVRTCGLEAAYEGESGIWFDPLPVVRREILWSQERFAQRGFATDQAVDGITFDKFCVWTNPNCDINQFLQIAQKYCTVVDREGDLLELVKLGCSKSTGVAYVAEWFGTPVSECYAIGDSTNDVPMLETVGHSIAMGNAPEELKDMVEYVTAAIEEDGIAAALAHYHLIAWERLN